MEKEKEELAFWKLNSWWKKAVYIIGWICLVQWTLSLVLVLTFFSSRTF
jgi:hypothetical protein